MFQIPKNEAKTRRTITVDEAKQTVNLSEFKDVYMIGIMFGLLYEFDFSIEIYPDDPEMRTPLIRSCISCQQPANYQCSKCPRATFCGSEKCSEKHFQLNHEC